MQAPPSGPGAGPHRPHRSPNRSPASPCSPSSPRTASPSSGASASPVAAPGCPLTALTLLHSYTVRPSALDAVRCYQPWCGVRSAGGLDGDLADDRTAAQPRSGMPSAAPASPAMYSAALCGLAGRIDDAFSPLPLAVQLPLPLPLPGAPRRPRSEKKPTPDDQKDQRYLERRRRNNRAAKKSRDARRAREDQVALRAALLEHENAVLRAQVMTLREETHSLRQLLLHGKGLLQLQHRDANGDIVMPRI